jgi:hypothetical protein
MLDCRTCGLKSHAAVNRDLLVDAQTYVWLHAGTLKEETF